MGYIICWLQKEWVSPLSIKLEIINQCSTCSPDCSHQAKEEQKTWTTLVTLVNKSYDFSKGTRQNICAHTCTWRWAEAVWKPKMSCRYLTAVCLTPHRTKRRPELACFTSTSSWFLTNAWNFFNVSTAEYNSLFKEMQRSGTSPSAGYFWSQH